MSNKNFKRFTDEEKKDYAKEHNKQYNIFLDEVKKTFINQLNEGTAPWQKPWIPISPMNFVTKTNYNGSNIYALSILGSIITAAKNRNFFDPRFCTPKNAFIKHWKPVEKATSYYVHFTTPKVIPLKEEEIEKIDLDKHKIFLDEEKTIPGKLIFVKKVYKLYNIADLEGENIPTFKESYGFDLQEPQNWNKGDEIEDMIEKLGVKIIHGSSKAFYSLQEDFISMPHKSNFISEEAYYSVLLHELSHWTASPYRLNRNLNGSKHSITYAKEEVIAEMSSYALSCFFGIRDFRSDEERTQSLSYTKNWLSSFSENKKIKAYEEASFESERIFKYITKHFTPKLENQKNINLDNIQSKNNNDMQNIISTLEEESLIPSM